MGIVSRVVAAIRRKTTKNYQDPAKAEADQPVQLLAEQMNSSLNSKQIEGRGLHVIDLNRRDLKYARDMGRWDILSQLIQEIRDNTVVLLERIPDIALTEKGFHIGVGELFRSVQLLMNSSTDRERVQAVEKVAEAAESMVSDLREKNIIEFLKFRGKSDAREVGYVLELSRSRTSQLLKPMEMRGALVAEKVGRKVLYRIAELTPDS